MTEFSDMCTLARLQHCRAIYPLSGDVVSTRFREDTVQIVYNGLVSRAQRRIDECTITCTTRNQANTIWLGKAMYVISHVLGTLRLW